jgi:hypothetical protein
MCLLQIELFTFYLSMVLMVLVRFGNRFGKLIGLDCELPILVLSFGLNHY